MGKFIKTSEKLPQKNRTLRTINGLDVGPGDWIELRTYIGGLDEEFTIQGQLSYNLEDDLYYLNEEIEVNLWDTFVKINPEVDAVGE